MIIHTTSQDAVPSALILEAVELIAQTRKQKLCIVHMLHSCIVIRCS